MKCPKCDADNRSKPKYCRERRSSLTGARESLASITKTMEIPIEG